MTSQAPPIGFGAYDRYKDRSFEQAEPELMRDWDHAKGTSKLPWESAKHATREAWQRVSDFVERATPGDSDRDRKQVGGWPGAPPYVADDGPSCEGATAALPRIKRRLR